MASEFLKELWAERAFVKSGEDAHGVMSKAHANTARERIKRRPLLMQALQDPRHFFHKPAQVYAARLTYYAEEHPHRPDGVPVPAPEMPGWQDPTADPFPGLSDLPSTPEEAKALREAFANDDSYRRLVLAGHPQAVEAMTRLARVAAGKPARVDMAARLAAEERKEELRFETKDPAHPYNDRRHPDHKAFNDEMSSLYAALDQGTGVYDGATSSPKSATPSALPAAKPASVLSDGPVELVAANRQELKTLHARISADPKHPYNDRRHPDYAQTQKRMNELYATTAPAGASHDPDSLESSGVWRQASAGAAANNPGTKPAAAPAPAPSEK